MANTETILHLKLAAGHASRARCRWCWRQLSLRSKPLNGMANTETIMHLKRAARHASRARCRWCWRQLSLRSKPLLPVPDVKRMSALGAALLGAWLAEQLLDHGCCPCRAGVSSWHQQAP